MINNSQAGRSTVLCKPRSLWWQGSYEAGIWACQFENKGFETGTKGLELDKAMTGKGLHGLSNDAYVYKSDLGAI